MKLYLLPLCLIALIGCENREGVMKITCGGEDAAISFPLPNSYDALSAGALRILVIGSSSTSGVGAGSSADAYPAKTASFLDDWDVEVFARGQSSETAAGALARMSDEMHSSNPDLVVWQVGTNDALQKLAIDDVARTIIDGIVQIRGQGVDLLLLDPQYFPRSEGNPRYAPTVEMMSALSDASDVGVVRRYARMKSAGEAIQSYLADDKLHMSALGHECLAQDLARAIKSGVALAATPN